MKVDFSVTGYVQGISKTGKPWLKLAGTKPVETSDKVQGSGYDVESCLLTGDKVSEALKAVDGHYIGAKCTIFKVFSQGKEFTEFLELTPKASK